MNILEILWDLFRKPKPVKLTPTGTITNEEVRALLSPFHKNNIWISDDYYTLVYNEDMQKFLKRNPVDKRKYITEVHDCDDFSFELMGDVSDAHPELAFGMVWGNRNDGVAHAWNFYIDENKQIEFVEPQTDEIFLPSNQKVWVMII